MPAVLFLFIGLGVLLWWWNRRTGSDFETLRQEQQLTLRPQCPVANPFGFDDKQLGSMSCYDGKLKPGVPMVLIFGVRSTWNVGVDPHPTAASYIAIYLPPGNKLDDAWLKKWQVQVENPKGRFPVQHAARTPDGGVVIAWNGAQARRSVEDRTADVIASLPGSN